MAERKDLEAALAITEAIADVVADAHEDCCPIGGIARAISHEAGEARRSMATSNGPAQVATDTYRRNWETIFGKAQPYGQA